MCGYIYKTTNKINNKIYIGQHKTNKDSIDEKYYGSGKLLLEAIEKYGKENFEVEILEWCETEEELNNKEIYWIKTLKSTTKNNNYNISDGGFVPRLTGEANGNFGKHRPHTEAEKEHLSHITKGHKPTFTRKRTQEEIEEIRIRMLKFKHKEESKQQIKEHHIGSKFMHKNNEQKWVFKEDIEKMLEDGWEFGACKKRNRVYVNTWNKGKHKEPTTKDKVGVTNGIINKYIHKDEIEKFLKENISFKKGITRRVK